MGQSACDCALQNHILDRITSCYICYICKSLFAVLHGHMHEVQIRHQVHTWYIRTAALRVPALFMYGVHTVSYM